MKSNSISTNNSYFDYAPVWSSANSPVLIKVANAAGSLILNLGLLLLNVFVGIGRLANHFFSDSSTGSNHFLTLPTPSSFPEPSAPPWDPNWGPYPG